MEPNSKRGPFLQHSASTTLSRRGFLGAAALAAAPLFIPASALGRDGRPAPSNRITLACIGSGGQGNADMRGFLGQDDVQVVAACDVDAKRLAETAKRVNDFYGNTSCKSYRDFREVLARPDIDTVIIATPDHWHAVVGIEAVRAGKDVYGEKPLTHSWREGRLLCDAVRQNGRIWQTGSQQRSGAQFRTACEIVRNGMIGKLHTVQVGLPAGNPGGSTKFTAPPTELDYEFWIGPAPFAPYSADRTHWNWRWQLDYGGGQLMDWIGHHGDIGHWGMGCDYSGPVAVEGKGEYPKDGLWNGATKYRFTATYANGVKLIVASANDKSIRGGTKFIGDGGWVWVNRGGIEASPASLLEEIRAPQAIRLYASPGHHRNFIDSVKSRRPTVAPAEVAHRSATIGHLGQVAMLLGRKIRWNPQTEQVIDDPAASAMLSPALRQPWTV